MDNPIDTMRSLVTSILGTYQPVIDANGNNIGGLASLDYTWLAGAAFFGIMLVGTLCILRTMIRGLFGNVR